MTTKMLAVSGGLLMAGIAWLAAAPEAAANGWYGGHYHCCYGHGYWGGWGYPRFAVGIGFPGYPYYGGYAPGFYGAAYPGYGYPPPAPSYPPAPVFMSQSQAQPPAAAAQPYVVYFDFDKATLTRDGTRVVDQAIAAANNGGHPQIQITGYTDAAGANQYNLALSTRRADAVADYMVAHGVPAEEIEVAGVGEQPQQVPTPDGVPNAQNRRVVIMVPGGAPANVASGYGNAQGQGGDCQPFQTTITIDQRQQQAYGRACRQADGSWKVVP